VGYLTRQRSHHATMSRDTARTARNQLTSPADARNAAGVPKTAHPTSECPADEVLQHMFLVATTRHTAPSIARDKVFVLSIPTRSHDRTYLLCICDFALRRLSMPMDLHFIPAIGSVLITALRICKPGSQVLLCYVQ